MDTNKKSRLTIDLAVEVRENLNRMKDETHADSLVEVVRRAIVLYGVIHQAQKDGHKIIRREGDKDTELVIFL